ncbi:MAG TPA: hypothetical protein VLW85_17505, partial [Myxococcales bacterium]|nr:hypothetical protein [Myxococcales bacterium]
STASVSTVADVSFGNSALQGVLPGSNESIANVTVEGTVTGPWQEIGGSGGAGTTALFVCAPISLTAYSLGAASTGFTDFFLEATLPDGVDPASALGHAVVCVIDDGVNNYIRYRFSRLGTPFTPTFLALSADEVFFRYEVAGTLPSRVWDAASHTLQIAPLMTTFDSLTVYTLYSAAQVINAPGGVFGATWYNAHLTGTMNFTLNGH